MLEIYRNYWLLIKACNKPIFYDITIINTGKLTIEPKEISKPEIIIEAQTYTGKELKPIVVIKDGDRIIPSTEYTVEYSDNIEPGIAKVTIKDVDGGNYIIQTIEATFNIIDPGIGLIIILMVVSAMAALYLTLRKNGKVII